MNSILEYTFPNENLEKYVYLALFDDEEEKHSKIHKIVSFQTSTAFRSNSIDLNDGLPSDVFRDTGSSAGGRGRRRAHLASSSSNKVFRDLPTHVTYDRSTSRSVKRTISRTSTREFVRSGRKNSVTLKRDLGQPRPRGRPRKDASLSASSNKPTTRKTLMRRNRSESLASHRPDTPVKHPRAKRRALQDVLKDEQDSLVENINSFEASLAKKGTYHFEAGDVNLLRKTSYTKDKTFGVGCEVAPTRNEIEMLTELVNLGQKDKLEEFESSVHQSCTLRSNAFENTWNLFCAKVNAIIKRYVKKGVHNVLESLECGNLIDSFLKVVLLDVGIDHQDTRLVLDMLHDELSASSKFTFIKVYDVKSVQDIINQSIRALNSQIRDWDRKNSSRDLRYINRHKETESKEAPEGSDPIPDTVNIHETHIGHEVDIVTSDTKKVPTSKGDDKDPYSIETFVKLCKKCKDSEIVLIFDKMQSITGEMLYTLLSLKDEGLNVSCILCSTAWQPQLETYCSLKVYEHLSIVNCDIIVANDVCDDIVSTLLWDTKIQTFIPSLKTIKQIWDIFFDIDMSITSLIYRIYAVFENFYSNYQFSFLNTPSVANIEAEDEDYAIDLYSKYSLLCMGAGISESHVAYLELKMGRELSLSKVLLDMLPLNSVVLYERRVSFQLGIKLLFSLLRFLPDCQTSRLRLKVIMDTFTCANPEQMITILIKKVSNMITTGASSRISAILDIFKEFYDTFKSIYPSILNIRTFLKKDLQDVTLEYDTLLSSQGNLPILTSSRLDSGSADDLDTFVQQISKFVGVFLRSCFLPVVYKLELANDLMVQKAFSIRNEQDVLNKLKVADKNGTLDMLMSDVSEIVKLSQVLPGKSIDMWSLFCLFYSQYEKESLSYIFTRFTIAIETLSNIYGYFEVSAQKTGCEIPSIPRVSRAKLTHTIKNRLQNIKIKRIHLGTDH
ncbi:hypothetical protein BEWA_014500 [Theileria equi strain WA]|uniref:Uncharacterized protein n=1 Tax=Theileria equi strain WA TaxID=1537102 RepID=L1LC25_THEEQ|nr:hypothetical protein BEWA_014500 [Theileria equi strain WA]EKX72891.1 hypothetical protein BEWA_014500 [Theileria equi strain WA]|eukprot:XP_004832343.1 hypothetical protein BEWA_014500 [Theileria equi strain WA]